MVIQYRMDFWKKINASVSANELSGASGSVFDSRQPMMVSIKFSMGGEEYEA